MKKVIFVTGMLLSVVITANAQQWSSAGNNIYNTNSGTVVIQPNGSPGGQKFVINPQAAGSFTLGEANTGAGGYTSLNFYISAYQNGYSSIQSIKSAGSSYGMLALNPGGGAVVIGGSTDPGGTYKLAVEGKIGAREVKVTLTNPWPDYVFSKNYRLPNLTEVEKYINANGHLPGMPSAAEVETNKGIELGEMNRKVVEKIEELTLYVIELKKENEQIRKENEQIKKELQKAKN